MAKKFYDLEETAEKLGITAEALNEMRGRNEIRGYRDGPTWKFKIDDIESVAQTLAEKAATSPDDSADDEIALEEPSEDEGSVLLSERELGAMKQTGSPSTIIGDTSNKDAGQSDLSLADSDIGLGADDSQSSARDEPGPMSDVRLAGGSDVLGGGEPASELGLQFEELDSLELDFDGTTDSTAPAGPTDDAEGSGDELSLTGESDLSLVDDDATETEDAVDLSGDDDLVLSEGSSGSDVTSRPGDSGISLMDPSDSGLSLEEVPLELGGSSIVSSEPLMLDEGDMLTLGDDGEGSSISGEPQRDFDLNIEEEAEDASESGSQVIALDAEEAFDPEAATMIGGAFAGDAAAMLEPDTAGEEPAAPDLGVVSQPAAAAFVSPSLPEAPYSIWNVLSLMVCILVLGLCGIMMFDMVRNIWSWDQSYPVNSSLMDWIIDMFSGK